MNSKEKSVVVIIPYYNGSAYIERSILSVLEQTVKADEFIIVDDGSATEEAQFLDEVASRSDIRVYHKENGGQGSARNFGVSQSTSNYIAFLDQDDFFLLNHIEILLNEVDEDPHFGWVNGDLYEANGDGKVFYRNVVERRVEKKIIAPHPHKNIYEMIKQDVFILPSASLISRQAFQDVNGFDEQFTGFEDDDLFLRITHNGWSSRYLNKPVTVWCINTDSTCFSIRLNRSRLKYIKKLCLLFPDDVDKGMYIINECVVPRFFQVIVKDAKMSMSKSGGPQQKKMNQHRDELYFIMMEFFKIIRKSTKLDKKINKKITRKIIKFRFWRMLGSLLNR